MTNWEDIFGPTPASFASRVQDTLAGLEEPKMTAHKNTKRKTIRTIILIAAAAALLMGTALAVTVLHGDFYNSAFGTGVPGREAETFELTGEDGEVFKTYSYPAIERVEVDEEKAEALIGENVVTVGRSVTLHGYTFTFADCVVDENGIAVVTIDVENPDGLNIRADGKYDIYAGEFCPFGFVFRGANSQQWWQGMDSRELVSTDTMTDTYARYVCYMAPDCESSSAVGGILVTLGAWDGTFDETVKANIEADIASGKISERCRGQVFPNFDEEEFTISVGKPVATREASAGDISASVSPIGMSLMGLDGAQGEPQTLAIRYQDGSEYVVHSEGVYNATVEIGCTDHFPTHTYISFNRLVDVDNIAAVVADDVVIAF